MLTLAEYGMILMELCFYGWNIFFLNVKQQLIAWRVVIMFLVIKDRFINLHVAYPVRSCQSQR